MMIRKKDRFEDRSGKKYEIDGKWCGDFVLSPVEASDDECLIYTDGEMLEFIETGHFRQVRGEAQ